MRGLTLIACGVLFAASGATAAPDEMSTGCPADLSLSYDYYTDYIFRGINFSEYDGEGREKANHQVNLALDLDLAKMFGNEPGTWGTFSFTTFFEWFAEQSRLDPDQGGQNLQEIDYGLTWSYDIEPCQTTLSIGYIFYSFPNAKPANTQEWWFGFEHNDAWMWKWLLPDNEDGVLNPTFAFYHDTALGSSNAAWAEIGISHEFALTDKLSLTPSATLGIDHNYYRQLAGAPDGSTTRFANMVYGLDLTYDLAEVLPLPSCTKSATVSMVLNFSDALGSAEDNMIIRDEFYGGISFGFGFGG